MMYWSYVLMLLGVTGLYFIGSKVKAGWYINIFAQVLWIVYAIVTKQWGFIISALVYAGVYFSGLRKFDKPEKKLPIRIDYDKLSNMGYIQLLGLCEGETVTTRRLSPGVMGDFSDQTGNLMGIEIFGHNSQDGETDGKE